MQGVMTMYGSQAPTPDQSTDTISAADVLGVLVRRRTLIAGIVLACSCVAAVGSLLLPAEFEATASVLPPPEARGMGGLQGLASQWSAASALTSLLQTSGTKDAFVGILKSRTMMDDVIRKFDLVQVYDVAGRRTPMRLARQRLEKLTSIKVSKEGVISVTATAYDPKMAADIANFYVENLDRLNTSLNVTDAGRSRRFLEARVSQAEQGLREAEEKLRGYQSQSGAVVLEGQAKAAIEGMARLEGQIQAAEVQLRNLETFSTSRNPDVIRLKESIDEMRRQLKQMEYGRESAARRRAGGGGAAADFAVPLGTIPETGIQLARLLRDTKLQETVFTLLVQQLEQMKIAEAKDTPTVRVLDQAVPPEWKSRPSVSKNTALAGLVSLLAALPLAFALENARGRKRAGD
jgi:uncharacterized protein involved in exopolysaccharide biosynthesis